MSHDGPHSERGAGWEVGVCVVGLAASASPTGGAPDYLERGTGILPVSDEDHELVTGEK